MPLDISRVVLASERKSGFVSPSILLLASMKKKEIPIHVFYAGTNMAEIALLKNILEDNITILPVELCRNKKIFKVFFELCAHHDKLNIVLCELGAREETVQTWKNSQRCSIVSEIAVPLKTSVFLCCYSESIPKSIAEIVSDYVKNIKSKNPELRVDGIIFVNTFDQSSFQLVEKMVGQNFAGLFLGFIPQELIPPMPKERQLFTASAQGKSSFLIRGVSTRIASMEGQLDYDCINAITKHNSEWKPAQIDEVVPPLKISKKPKIAIIDEIELSGEGDNSEVLFKVLGCEIIKVKFTDILVLPDIDMFYLPNGLGFLLSEKISPSISTKIKLLMSNNKIFFANGGSSSLFAEKIIISETEIIQGLDILHGDCQYIEIQREMMPMLCNAMSNGLLTQVNELMSGYYIPDLNFLRKTLRKEPASEGFLPTPLWLCNELLRNKKNGIEGAIHGYEVANAILPFISLDLWSNIEAIRRLLTKKR